MPFYSSDIEAQLILGKKNTTLSALARQSLEQCAGRILPEVSGNEDAVLVQANFPPQDQQQAVISALEAEQFRLLQAFLQRWESEGFLLPPLLVSALVSLASHKKREFSACVFSLLKGYSTSKMESDIPLKKLSKQAEKYLVPFQKSWPEEAAYALTAPSIHHAPTLWQTALRVCPWSQEVAQALLHALHELLPHYTLRSEAYRWSFLPELFAERLPQAFWPSFESLRKSRGYPKSWQKAEKSVQEILRLRQWFEE